MRTVGRRKITHGHVIQTFDDNGKCIEQEFNAGDEVEWESEDMEPLDEADDRTECEYQPFHMVHPQAMTVALVGNISEGYDAVGPFTDFDEAARWAEGRESWIMNMQSPYEEFDSAKIPATEIPVVGKMTESGQVVLNEGKDKGVTPEQIRSLVKTLENPRRSLQIRIDSVARQIRAIGSRAKEKKDV